LLAALWAWPQAGVAAHRALAAALAVAALDKAHGAKQRVGKWMVT
jgi:hypothetical protein